MNIDLSIKGFKQLERREQSILMQAYREYLRNPKLPHAILPHKFGQEPMFGVTLQAGGALRVAIMVSGRNPTYGYRLTDEAIAALKKIASLFIEEQS